MTLRQQFEDLVHLGSTEPLHSEEEFIGTILEAAEWRDAVCDVEKKLRKLRKDAAKKERMQAMLEATLKSERIKLEEERKKTKQAEDEKRRLELCLENIRNVVFDRTLNITHADVLSLIESATSDASEMTLTEQNVNQK